jgi:Zn-dependent membrane protease YugP
MVWFGGYFWVLIPVIILTFYAQSKVKSNYNKFAKVRNMRGLTGAQVAEEILRSNSLHHVKIQRGNGQLSDHYNPRTETIVLSPHVYDQPSISAASIAAHECGHAVQHATGYSPLAVRSLIAPAAQFASMAAGALILIGIIFARSGMTFLIDFAIIAYLFITLFHIVTLPVEFNASKRAIGMLTDYGLLYDEDIEGTKKVLNAAALTYIAAMLSALMTVVRLVLIRNRR